MLVDLIVKLFGGDDSEGKIVLKEEVYKQNNIAAAVFSSTLSMIFVNFIRFLDILGGDIMIMTLRISNVLVFTLIAVMVYNFLLGRKITLFGAVFVDNNTAAAISFFGFVAGIQLVLVNILSSVVEYNVIDTTAVSLACMCIFGVLVLLFKKMFVKVIKVNLFEEVYKQNNIGAAIGQCALYIGVALVIVHFVK